MRSRFSFANVVSCLALFVALGGTSYAVIKLPRNSVGSREIKNRSVRAVVRGTPGDAASVARIGTDPGSVDAGDLVVQEGRVLTGPTAVRLHCGHDITLAGGTPRVDHAQVTATRVASLDVQPG